MNAGGFYLYLMVIGLAGAGLRAAGERTVEKTFPGHPGLAVSVDLCEGPLRVEDSKDGDVHLVIREVPESSDGQVADREARSVQIEAGQDNRGVRVAVRFDRRLQWSWQTWPPVSLSGILQVPPDSRLELRARNGDLTMGNHGGPVNLRAERGAVFTGEIRGALRIASGRGDVSVTACTGDLVITAGSGNVLVGRAGGSTRITASGGLAEVQNARGPLRIEADGADIRAAFEPPCREPAELRAAGGDIEVVFDQRDACTLKATASHFGKVSVRNLSLAVESGKPGTSRLVATLNGGGPVVRIDASGGNVHLVGREP